MSVLETPRLIFRGQVTWDPIVTNNQPQQYDENDSKTVSLVIYDLKSGKKILSALHSSGFQDPWDLAMEMRWMLSLEEWRRSMAAQSTW